jgi:hypothetical protein
MIEQIQQLYTNYINNNIPTNTENNSETECRENSPSEFKLPIELSKYINTDTKVCKDLELIDNNDNINDTNETPYSILLNKNKTILGNKLLHKWASFYSNNTKFLNKFQKTILQYSKLNKTNQNNKLNDNMETNKNNFENSETFYKYWNDFKNETSFCEKYNYISWKHLQFINQKPEFLQMLCYYDLSSPFLNFLTPLLFFIIPIVLIVLIRKQSLTFASYKVHLYNQFKNHAIGKLFMLFSGSVTREQLLIILGSISVYFFTIYQSILTFYKTYSNLVFITSFMESLYKHLEDTKQELDIWIPIYKKYKLNKQYKEYQQYKTDINELLHELTLISLQHSENNGGGFSKLFHMYSGLHSNILINVGKYQTLFYELYHSKKWNKIIETSFDTIGYSTNIQSLSYYLKTKQLNPCKFIQKHTKSQNTYIKKQYYPFHIEKNPIKNSVDMTNNYIITGPNASGKTTIMKTTLLNILFSQQFGYGCYERCKIQPYDGLYSYLNIMDSSEKNSLFQAEAKQCLDIITHIKHHKNTNAFVIFDELFSGTNHYEAVIACKSYINYLIKHRIQFMITTHLQELTDSDSIKKNINNNITSYITQNYHMKSYKSEETNRIHYTYEFIPGVSTIRGGFEVLKQAKFPDEIMKSIYYLDSLN